MPENLNSNDDYVQIYFEGLKSEDSSVVKSSLLVLSQLKPDGLKEVVQEVHDKWKDTSLDREIHPIINLSNEILNSLMYAELVKKE